MFKWICRWLFKFNGWTVGLQLPEGTQQCVLIGAPHTSNWDFIYALAAYEQMGLKVRFTIKKEWVSFPFKTLFKSLGAIPIDRSAKQASGRRASLVDSMVDLFHQDPYLVIMVTPEGTRSPVKRWKMGFYQVAKTANVPIALGYLDYAKKEAGIGGLVYPTEDTEQDLRKVYDFYHNISPKFPERFVKL